MGKNEIKITSDLFSAVTNSMNSYYESFVFRYNGVESPYQQDMENILTDILLASENGKDYITVDENVMKGLCEVGVFKGVM